MSGARQSAASSSSRAPPKTKTRRRAERTGRRQPPRRWPPATGSQPRPDVQEGRPTTAPTRAAEAQARGQRAEHEPRGQARHLAPSRVQRRGVEARRVSRRAWGGEARERRAGGMVRAARQRREVSRIRRGQGPATAGNTFERRPRRTTIFLFVAFRPKSPTGRGTRRADAARHFRDW